MTALDGIKSWPVGDVSAGWVSLDGKRNVAGESDLEFPLASVTKPLFAYAVLIAIEEGTLGLDDPAGPPGSSIRHLLAHASGLGDDPDQPINAVGTRRIYSNGAYELLGVRLADASGMSAADYAREAVVEPLGLAKTSLEGSPAHGATSTVDDLLAVAAEWLAPTLVSTATMDAARSAQFGELAGVLPGYGRQDPNPWGLGFELKGSKVPHWTGATNSPATFGHFGRAGTFIWIDPNAGVGCVALTDETFGPWAIERWPALSDAVVAEAAERR